MSFEGNNIAHEDPSFVEEGSIDDNFGTEPGLDSTEKNVLRTISIVDRGSAYFNRSFYPDHSVIMNLSTQNEHKEAIPLADDLFAIFNPLTKKVESVFYLPTIEEVKQQGQDNERKMDNEAAFYYFFTARKNYFSS